MAILIVYSLGDFFPRGDLLRSVQPRSAGIAFRLERNLSGFSDDQAGTGALSIIFAH
ncbi:hypothetical protein D3C72_1956150 [compost metagenome]